MIHRFSLMIAEWLARLMPETPNLDDTTDCYFFHSARVKRASTEHLQTWQQSSSQWRYDYEIQYRTLDHTFRGPLEPYLRDKVVLDFGCGMGGAAAAWAERYQISRIHGFEAEHVLAQAASLFTNKKGLRADFLAAEGEALPYQDRAFDAIISLDVFEHVRND